MDIFILSCSAGLSTEYRVLPGTVTSTLQDQPRLWSDHWKKLMELLNRSRQTNRGVCPCRGDSVAGETLDIYMQIFLVLAQNFSIPSYQPVRQTEQKLQISNYFCWYFNRESPPVICLLSGFPFQFYRRKEELQDCSLLWWRPDSCFLIFPLSSLSPGNNWSLSFSSLSGPVLSVFCFSWRRKFEEISF